MVRNLPPSAQTPIPLALSVNNPNGGPAENTIQTFLKDVRTLSGAPAAPGGTGNLEMFSDPTLPLQAPLLTPGGGTGLGIFRDPAQISVLPAGVAGLNKTNPASQGVYMLAFNGQAIGFSPGQTLSYGGTAPASDAKTVAFGDSISAHLIRKAGVSGQESGKVGVFNSGDTAVSGYGPADVLSVIGSAAPENIKGNNVLLSTGVSNKPAEVAQVKDQIALLKSRGAASVTVLGVGTDPRLQGMNDQLSQIAADNGARFSGAMRSVAADGIHSSNPADLLRQAQMVIPAATPGQITLPTDPTAAAKKLAELIPGDQWKIIPDNPVAPSVFRLGYVPHFMGQAPKASSLEQLKAGVTPEGMDVANQKQGIMNDVIQRASDPNAMPGDH
jgi:hypothetical protein